jgi:hypothetical protein
MIPVDNRSPTADRAALLDEALERAWQAICRKYDVSAPQPDLQELLIGASFTGAELAARYIFAQMLLDAVEEIGRFSPWYRLPERAFGLVSMRNPVSRQVYRMLAPEAILQWQEPLSLLTRALEDNHGLLQAILLVNSLIGEAPEEESCLTAYCQCDPPRAIQVKPSILESAHIVCAECQEPFS